MENHKKFYQQRKNLLLSSIAISIYEIIGLEIEVINILGNQVSISTDQNIEAVLIVFWLYSLIRFFQYSSIEKNYGHKKLVFDWLKHLDDYRHKYIFEKIVRTINDKNANSDRMGGSRPFKYEYLTKESIFKWAYIYKPYDPLKDRETSENSVKTHFNAFEILRPYVAASLKIILFRPTFTENILPYLIALSTLGIIVYY